MLLWLWHHLWQHYGSDASHPLHIVVITFILKKTLKITKKVVVGLFVCLLVCFKLFGSEIQNLAGAYHC